MPDRFEIIDTWPDFCDYWNQARDLAVKEQMALWRNYYLADYPELFQMQVDNYAYEGVDWRSIAEKIFPTLPEKIGRMQEARDNILKHGLPVCRRAFQKLGIDFDMVLVIHVGIGSGAGWATAYAGNPAVLLGLENIAEEGWETKDRLKGLVSHEIGHLAHLHWRAGQGSADEAMKDPLFLLYSEGFAQRCEQVINGEQSWHMAPDEEWISWCRDNLGWLAGEFLGRLESKGQVKDFFGSWFDIEGRKQTGYFLGHAFITELEKTCGLKEIAVFDITEVHRAAREYLSSLAAGHFGPANIS